MDIKRAEFIKKVTRIIIASILAIIGIALGSKTVLGNDCAKCPGNGVCKGESDCDTFLSKKR